MLHIRPPKGSRHIGCDEWQGEQDPKTAEHNPRQQEEDQSVHPWLLWCVQSLISFSGFLVACRLRVLVANYPTTTITRHLSVFTYGRFWLDCLPTRNCWMCLGGGQVAVLGLHAAVSLPRNDCTILAELGERVTQLQNLLLARSFQALKSLGNSVNTPRT
jgi:hypothetical protein